jgi:hypothetical protein
MEPSVFDEVAFFRALDQSRARALLIGRRALVLLGLPVLTADYDFWLSIDDIPAFNAVGKQFDLHPNRTPEEARRHGRYVLENDEHIDVLISRSVPTIDGHVLEHDALWSRRRVVALADTRVYLPSLDDLILTKQVATRPKDLEDDRRVTPEELGAELERPIGPGERDDVLSLVGWFTTRYATPEARLSYVRRAYARWTASRLSRRADDEGL